MHIDDSFFEEEIRNGFKITSMMKRFWAAQMEVLQYIDRVCSKLGISYYADYGTLLGAVRHKGFIPWDDDTDICMKRKDYIYFMEHARDELPQGFKILSPYGEFFQEWEPWLSRIVNNTKPCVDKEFLREFHGCPYAAGIDIFPLDNIPDNNGEAEMQKKVVDILCSILLLCENDNLTEKQKKELRTQVEVLCNVRLDNELPTKRQLSQLINSICGMYQEEDTEYIGNYYYWTTEDKEKKIPASAFRERMKVTFEMIKVPIPIGYDKVLKVEFGADYMTPKCIGGDHDYPCYALQKIQLKKYLMNQKMRIEDCGIDSEMMKIIKE